MADVRRQTLQWLTVDKLFAARNSLQLPACFSDPVLIYRQRVQVDKEKGKGVKSGW